MAFHVRDPKTDALVRRLAKLKGVGITEAIREAAEHELAREGTRLPLMERIRDLTDVVDATPKTGLEADKAFYDELSGEDQR